MKFNSLPAILFCLILACAAVQAVHAGEAYQFIATWGSLGTGDGQFMRPIDVALDSSDNVYVVDLMNSRIQKFTADGRFITKWGSPGTADGQFDLPQAVVADKSGNIYVADGTNNRIQKFNSNGVFITKWGGSGSGDGQFLSPLDIAIDPWGYVYVADGANNRIQKFSPNGTFIAKWGTKGAGNGQFDGPSRIAIDSKGTVYVIDWNGGASHGVQKFDVNGNFIAHWGPVKTAGGFVSSLSGIDVDSAGNVYLIQYSDDFIIKYSPSGQVLTQWGSMGYGDGQFILPAGIAIDSSGNVYVSDGNTNTNRSRIQKFAPITTPPIPQPAALVITSTPTDAGIYVDGTIKGSTPTTLTLDSGTYTITVKKSGYSDYSLQVSIGAGQTMQITADLPAIRPVGSVIVTSSPAGADVFLDDVPVGKTPMTLHEIVPGIHILRAGMPSYRDEQKIIDVLTGETISVPIILAPVRQKAVIMVYSTPSSADVLVDGKYEGITPSKITVDAGNHQLLVVLDDKSKEVPISVSEGETKDITVDLPGFEAVLGICAIFSAILLIRRKEG